MEKSKGRWCECSLEIRSLEKANEKVNKNDSGNEKGNDYEGDFCGKKGNSAFRNGKPFCKKLISALNSNDSEKPKLEG